MALTVVLLHGILSSGDAWSPLIATINDDPILRQHVNVLNYQYPANAVSLKPGTRIPDLGTVAGAFKADLESSVPAEQPVTIIAHSQGGLVAQRYLAQEIQAGRGLALRRIRSVVLLACPNSGSEYLLSMRKMLGFWRNPQERELRPLSDAVYATGRVVVDRIVYAKGISEGSCPIPIYAYAGQSDGIVTEASARSMFALGGVLPGDHSSIIRDASVESVLFKVIRPLILSAAGVTDRHARNVAGGETSDARMVAIKHIADALVEIDEFMDLSTRRQLIKVMPPNIRQTVELAGGARGEVVALVEGCMRFRASGRAALIVLLQGFLPQEDPKVISAQLVLLRYWPEESKDD